MLFPFQAALSLELSQSLVAWLGWGVFLLAIAALAFTWRDKNIKWDRRRWILLAGLFLSVFLTTPFLGIHLPVSGALPIPGIPVVPSGPALMFLSPLPWMICGGLLGVIPATVLGGTAGLLLALLDTHNPFTPLEIAALALLFSIAVRQRYRTWIFSLFRHPLFTAFGLCVAYALIYMVSPLLTTPGPLVGRVDYALSNFIPTFLAVSGSVLVSALFAEVTAQALAHQWGRTEPLSPSPSETTLLYRVLFNILPGALALLVLLAVGDYFVSQNTARQMLQDRLSNTAQLASEGIPYFMETGQDLILQFAKDSQLSSQETGPLSQVLANDLTLARFFRQLVLLDKNQAILAASPTDGTGLLNFTPEEKSYLNSAFKGAEFQVFTTAPSPGDTTAEIVFLAAIKGPDGNYTRALWGRTDLSTNPYTGPVIKVLADMSSIKGEGQLIDENGLILYHPQVSRLMSHYLGKTTSQPDFFDGTAPDGARQLVFFQPVAGAQWGIALSVPATQIQQLALNIAVPLLFVVLLISAIGMASLSIGLRAVTASLVTLSGESQRISQGQLDHVLPPPTTVDEIGRLRDSFEQMRLSLKARLDELNRLLVVSQGVASSLEIQDAIQPILDAALTNKACLARVVLVPDKTLEMLSETSGRFGIGPASSLYSALDDEILSLTEKRETITLTNLTRGKGLNILPGTPHPSALMAVALRREARFYGALWVAYDTPRLFTKEETSFLHTLAGEAAMAAANARLYSSAELGRQRLEAILASTPEPVLVTDQDNRIMLTNPAALQLPSLSGEPVQNRPVTEVLTQNDLLSLLTTTSGDVPSREIAFPNGRVYFATVSPVIVDSQLVGKVCILRDITHYKELDSLKSEFVATVSHDLRSPLTLMRGYATMLPMVGDLNEQQKRYVRKVVNGVENMSRLVNNLLDLGRIEAGMGLRLGRVSASDITDHVITSLQLQAAQKEIQLNVDFLDNSQTILQADPALLQQALYNLVENAIKYTPSHGQVFVDIQTRPNTILFSVRDTGIGIAPIDQPRLFEKFYRGGQRENQRGTGLGLAIVKSIAERHGGRVWLESVLGKGSSFYFEIPRSQSRESKLTQNGT